MELGDSEARIAGCLDKTTVGKGDGRDIRRDKTRRDETRRDNEPSRGEERPNVHGNMLRHGLMDVWDDVDLKLRKFKANDGMMKDLCFLYSVWTMTLEYRLGTDMPDGEIPYS